MELYTDTYYIQRIQAGDTACFACLLDKYSRPVHSLILKVVRNREDAEELAQDVFMKVFKHLSSFKGECSFSTWIYRIAYNTAISETRKKRHEFLAIEESVINNVSEQEVAEALDRTDSSDQIQMLDAALAQLPPDERAIILLFYMKEKTIDEVATITGLTASNIKVKLHRIRNERWGWIAVIAASLLMVGIAIASFLYMNISPISVQIPNMSTLPFYAYIGMLALILLGADYKFRQLFKRRQMSQKEKM